MAEGAADESALLRPTSLAGTGATWRLSTRRCWQRYPVIGCLTKEIGAQVRANAGVAHRKHRLTHAAILSLLLGLLALVAVAVVIVKRGDAG